MKEFAMNTLWFMIAIVCISITISTIMYPFIQASKEKQKQKDLDALIEWLNSVKDDTNKN